MLELLTTDHFATWFSALAAGPAEDVAATLEVIVQLGTRTEAPGSSEWLLWYEHPSFSQRHLPYPLPPELVKFSSDWGHFNGYVRRVIKHLESAQFVGRMAHLPPADAAAVSAAVERIRRIAKTRVLALADFLPGRRRSQSPARVEAYARFVDVSEVREAYFAALAAAGFDVTDVPPHSAALREIALRSTAPGLRLLYGIDEPRNRGLVVLGEWLDRSFYGDSVRRAEAVWGEFLGGHPLSTQPARAR
ncbi:MAG: hypothetical protein ACLQVI_41075 [Polyangiaceae bacterium]|jgi:hypothetical protein